MNKRNIKWIIALSLTLMLSLGIAAEEKFDITAANQELAKAAHEYKSISNSLEKLQQNTKLLNELQAKAATCVSEAQSQLEIVEGIKNATKEALKDKPGVKFNDYIKNKSKMFTDRLSECKVFILKSKETLVLYKNSIQQLTAKKLFTREAPLWDSKHWYELNQLHHQLAQSSKNSFDFHSISSAFWIGGSLIVFFSILLGSFLNRTFSHIKNKQDVSQVWRHTLLATLSYFSLPLLVLFALALIISGVLFDLVVGDFWQNLNYGLLIFCCSLFFVKIFFRPPAGTQSLFKIAPNLAKPIERSAIFLLLWIFVGYLFSSINQHQPISNLLFELIRTLYVTILSGFLFWFCWILVSSIKLKHREFLFRESLHSILIVLLIIGVVAEWLGYHQLSIYLVVAIIFTVLSTLGLIFSFYLIEFIRARLDNKQYPSARWVRFILGVGPHRNLVELGVAELVGFIFSVYLYILAFMHSWNFSQNSIDAIEDGFFEGFHLSKLNIVPGRILIALLSFVFIVLLGRFFSTRIQNRKTRSKGLGTQVAMATIFLYCSFSFAIVFALLVVGVNFTGLAIIAGALSVGVGLGLQSIVNNFFSGLILLIEKPVKPGDRVIVGDVEGFIKKVRLRSTQITTLAKEDVIVPNSDMIVNKVTNLMFRSQDWRVVCKVGVTYGSDIDLVKQVLLEVAEAHPGVIHEVPDKPSVLFRTFGDSSLNFELWCIIRDVNQKFRIESELNFAIDKAFRKNNIVIAFPQCDIHIIEKKPR